MLCALVGCGSEGEGFDPAAPLCGPYECITYGRFATQYTGDPIEAWAEL